MDDTKKKFAKRLSEAMKSAGYEPLPAVLEREFNQRYWGKGMTLHGVRRWLRGETLPTQDKLLALAEWLRVPPQQLRYGIEVDQRIQQQRKRWDEEIGYQEREIFEAFLQLPVPQRKVIREVILAFSRAYALPLPREGEQTDRNL
ncbi:MAG: XRE family transcriptional regulator [Pseudomonadota bacterium]|nr:XRE family transcriptional regulator [Pseudomonadota bacterium]